MNRATAFLLLVGLAACGGGGTDFPTNTEPPAPLQADDLVVGDGAVAEVGDRLTVHYEGRLENGNVFESSYASGVPFVFTVGVGQVIAGWDQGIPGMQVGGQRRLTIPPHLAYGNTSPSPAIPPNATLIFDVELLSIEGK